MTRRPLAWLAALAMAFGTGCDSHQPSQAPASKSGGAPAATAQPEKAPAAVQPAPTGQPVPSPAPPPKLPEPTKTPGATPTKAPDSGVTPLEQTKDWFITVERAKELYDKKELDGRQVIFVDARTYNEFLEGHIRGAMCYSTKYTQGSPQPKLKNYMPGSAVVIYCHGELCTDSVDVGRYFQSLHLDIGPIFVIKDGLPGWQKAYPNLVDKGAEIGFN